jgi:hypothetical protein
MNELRFIGDEGYQQWLSLNIPIFQNGTQNRYTFQEIYSDFLRQHDYNILGQDVPQICVCKGLLFILIKRSHLLPIFRCYMQD